MKKKNTIINILGDKILLLLVGVIVVFSYVYINIIQVIYEIRVTNIILILFMFLLVIYVDYCLLIQMLKITSRKLILFIGALLNATWAAVFLYNILTSNHPKIFLKGQWIVFENFIYMALIISLHKFLIKKETRKKWQIRKKKSKK